MNLDKAKKKLTTYFTEASKVLNIDYKSITFKYEGIGKRFKTNDVTCEASDNKLFINLDWLNMLPENEDYDLKYQMYHEARHFYQHNVIKDYHRRGKASELLENTTATRSEQLHKSLIYRVPYHSILYKQPLAFTFYCLWHLSTVLLPLSLITLENEF